MTELGNDKFTQKDKTHEHEAYPKILGLEFQVDEDHKH